MSRSTQIQQNQVRRILLIADFSHLGDALRINPYVRAVRERYPAAELVMLASESSAAAFAGSALCDRVIVSTLYYQSYRSSYQAYLHKGRELLRLIWQLGLRYDLVVTFWWGTTVLHLLGLLVGWRGQRIGYAQKHPWLLTSQLGPFDLAREHQGQHRALVHAAGIDAPAAPPEVHYTKADVAAIEQLLEAHRLAGSRRLAVLHPGADWACQQWVQDRWSQLADALVSRYEVDVVFTGVAREQSYIDAVRRQMTAPSRSLAGQTTVRQLAALLDRAWICICVDSAVFEVSQSIGLPTVVLAGPSLPEEVTPAGWAPRIVTRMGPDVKRTVNQCRAPRYASGGCLEYACPMAGLREIPVSAALEAVAEQMTEAGACCP